LGQRGVKYSKDVFQEISSETLKCESEMAWKGKVRRYLKYQIYQLLLVL